jgi:dihydrofolate reductase
MISAIVAVNEDWGIGFQGKLLEHIPQDMNYFKNDFTNVFVIGGEAIYKKLLPYCDRVYITKIYKKHENVDTYFPNLDESDEWIASPIEEPAVYHDLSYQFWQYDRKS